MATKTRTVKLYDEEYEVRFTRRRYGSKTYTWGEVKFGEEWHNLWHGDAWPAVNPPKVEIQAGIAELLAGEEVPHPSQQLGCFI